MGSPSGLSLDYRPSVTKKSGGFVDMGRDERLEERLRCLEEERKKIDVFKRELPLCMELVNEAIESVKRQMEQQECRMGLPVLEEFIPLKKSSPEEEGKRNGLLKEEKDRRDKMNWMSSALLWNESHVPADLTNKRMHGEFVPSENSQKFSTSQSRMAFLPSKGASGFPEAPAEERDVSADLSLSTESKQTCKTQSSSPDQSAIQSQTQRKARRCWSPELHRRFVNSLQQLGGPQVATPKQIRELMKVDGLTNDEVKSHLQKYRLHTRRPNAGAQAPAGNQQSSQLMLLGGLWVPHEYSSSARGEDYQTAKRSPSHSGSPQGPLHFPARASNYSREEDEDEGSESDTKSESYNWKGHLQASRSDETTE
ncbi:Two-component response regulator [Nymphaea thermarum]|nr:Two-component response regulator [Nymphaea thermarum]